MDAIQAYYDGSVFVPVSPVKVKLNQPALITIIEAEKSKANRYNHIELFGKLSADSYLEIAEALKETEKVDINEW
ncbi:MAG: hypothetical protein FWG36_04655 [Oscillospiraceae bacterium]|nr:hypothetical protein [Oscillospiraceae bacterium]